MTEVAKSLTSNEELETRTCIRLSTVIFFTMARDASKHKERRTNMRTTS